VSALTATTGQVKWIWRLGRLASDTANNVFRSGAQGVAVSGDTVLVTLWHFTNLRGGTSESLLVALDRATGAELWKRVLNANTSGGAVATPPVLVANLALVLGLNGDLWAVRRSTGQIAWQYKSPAYQFGTLAAPVVNGGTIYASLGDETLTALRPADGAVLWSAPPRGATEDLFATDTRVYVPRDGVLYIHDRATGALIATGRVKVAGQTFTTAAAARGNQIFITSTEGTWSFREPE
jgi:outer membrane protein assembly factor BamB